MEFLQLSEIVLPTKIIENNIFVLYTIGIKRYGKSCFLGRLPLMIIPNYMVDQWAINIVEH